MKIHRLVPFFPLLLVAANWADFLPQTRLAPIEADLPLTWSPEENQLWQAEILGDGQSSPVVWDDHVVVTSVDGDMKDQNIVTCYAVSSGAKQWQRESATSLKVKSSLYVSRAAPTPVADSAGLVAFFESGDLIALDWDGNPRWQKSLISENGPIEAEFGLAASLAQDSDFVFVLVESDGPSYLAAIAKADGSTRWKVDRDSVISWSSPALMTLAGRPQIVVSSVGSVTAYEAATGNRLWTVDGLGGNTVATPSQVDSTRLIIGAAPGRDGKDTDSAAKSNLLIEVSGGDTAAMTAKVIWRADKAMASFSTPLAHDGLGYWVNRAGVVFCVDLETGEQLFAERLDQAPWATAIASADRIYFFGKDGITTVIATGREFRKLASNVLWDPETVVDRSAEASAREETAERRAGAAMFAGPIQYGVAVAGDRLLIRTGNRLVAIAGE